MHLTPSAAVLLSRMWWTFILRGVLAILFGLIALFVPGIALIVLLAIIAAWLIVDGIAAITAAWGARSHSGWWVQLLEGIASLAVGLLMILWPIFTAITAIVLLYLVAIWSIVTGVLEVWLAVRLRRQIDNEVWMAIAGVLSVLFGLYLIFFPGLGILSVLWLVGIFAIIWGISLIALGWRLRGIHHEGQRVGGGYAGSHP